MKNDNFLVLKQYISIVMSIITFTFFATSNVLAVHDVAQPVKYSVKKVGGENVFLAHMPSLKYLPYFGISEDPDSAWNGDMNIELLNPWCLPYIALFLVCLAASNPAVKVIAFLALIAIVSIVYSIAYQKLDDFEVCGADWTTWGYDDDEDANLLNDITKFYPQKGAFKGSKKWISDYCVKDTKKCIEWCQSKSKCSKRDCLEFPGGEECFLDTKFMADRDYLDMRDKLYREHYYNGEEVPTPNCNDPRKEAKTYDINRSGSIKQVYYFRGNEMANYACDRFLVLDDNPDVEMRSAFESAYNCCLNESKKVCVRDMNNSQKDDVPNTGIEGLDESIEGVTDFFSGKSMAGWLGGDSKIGYFCETSQVTGMSNPCQVGSIFLNVERGQDDGKYCVSTWSLCPYNVNLQKGSEKRLPFKLKDSYKNGQLTIEDECYDSTKDEALSCKGRAKNFYQLDRHCTYVIPYADRVDEPEDHSPYIDKSCINMVGSSHNSQNYSNYNGYEIAPNIFPSSFTAPLVECITETMKNFLYNRSGHTACTSGELASSDETCPDSSVLYKRHEDFNKTQKFDSPTIRLVRSIQGLITIMMAIMIMLYGWSILLEAGKVETKDLMIMLVKMMIVLGFTADNWWYSTIYQFVYTASDHMSSLTSKIIFDDTIDLTGRLVHDDGCFFGDIQDFLGTKNESQIDKLPDNNYRKYPSNQRYVMFFDTLDCKIERYLGASNLGSGWKIVQLVAGTFIWPFNFSLYLMVGSLVFMLFVVSFSIRAVLLFTKNAISLGLFLFLAPMCIPGILFKKTKPFFDNWLKMVVNACFQPMIYFAYISFALSIIDKYMLGSSMYIGHGKSKQLVCGYACVATVEDNMLDADGGFQTNNIVLDYVQNRKDKNVINAATAACRDYEGQTEFVDLRQGSVLCFMEELNMSSGLTILQPLGIFISIFSGASEFLASLIMLLKVAFLMLVLDATLDMIPKIVDTIVSEKGLVKSSIDGKLSTFKLAKDALDYSKMGKGMIKGLAKKTSDWVKGDGDKKDDEKKVGRGDNAANKTESKGEDKKDGGGKDDTFRLT
ncbi:MAG: hypothetical protein Ta2D_02900 [Rickettsiales bacterium]|nr:MAG: hypothetical protein Ta2D_02900 [Rickettsiales bacterium]